MSFKLTCWQARAWLVIREAYLASDERRVTSDEATSSVSMQSFQLVSGFDEKRETNDVPRVTGGE
jgi:hypothetical protein